MPKNIPIDLYNVKNNKQTITLHTFYCNSLDSLLEPTTVKNIENSLSSDKKNIDKFKKLYMIINQIINKKNFMGGLNKDIIDNYISNKNKLKEIINNLENKYKNNLM